MQAMSNVNQMRIQMLNMHGGAICNGYDAVFAMYISFFCLFVFAFSRIWR